MKRLMLVWVMLLFMVAVIVCSSSNAETITAVEESLHRERMMTPDELAPVCWICQDGDCTFQDERQI